MSSGVDSLHVVARLYDVASGRSLEQTQQSIPIATDSTFALAHYKRALAHGWSHLPDSTNVAMIEAASRHADRLPPRERSLIDSYLAMARGLAALNRGERALAPPYLEQARRRYADLVSRDSAGAESWYGLGDAHFHSAQVADDRLNPPQYFLTLWRNADPVFAATELRLARQGLARMRGEPGERARG